MCSLRSQGQPTLATLNCTSLRNLNCHFKSLRLPWLPDNMDITHWLPNNMDITALARATHRRTHAHTHTWGKYNQIPLRCTHACTSRGQTRPKAAVPHPRAGGREKKSYDTTTAGQCNFGPHNPTYTQATQDMLKYNTSCVYM